jgi:hypothetical protein
MDKYVIVKTCCYDYLVMKNGIVLRAKNNHIRYFVSRNSARKRISRERSGNFHQ